VSCDQHNCAGARMVQFFSIIVAALAALLPCLASCPDRKSLSQCVCTGSEHGRGVGGGGGGVGRGSGVILRISFDEAGVGTAMRAGMMMRLRGGEFEDTFEGAR
jgi:hypothetical protein